MKKRALVAGGAGFIGSHLVDYLLDRDYDVVVIDSMITGRRENLAHALKGGVKLFEIDIR
ncbi:MAG: NAD-dependent epimerase/dehydratase family protein, partial [Bdellovibrionota bacterium]